MQNVWLLSHFVDPVYVTLDQTNLCTTCDQHRILQKKMSVVFLTTNAYERTFYSIGNIWCFFFFLTDFCLHTYYTHFESCWPCWYLETIMCTQLLVVIFFLHGTAIFHYLSFVLLSLKTKLNLCLQSSCFNSLFCELLSMYFFCMEWSKNMQMHWPSSCFFLELWAYLSCDLFCIWLGLVQMVPDATTLAKIHRESGLIGPLKENTIRKWFRHHHRLESSYQEVTS